MMRIPPDCQLLRLGMTYCLARAIGDWGKIGGIIARSYRSNDMFMPLDVLQSTTSLSKFQNLSRNAFYIHPSVSIGPEDSSILIKYKISGGSECVEKLIVEFAAGEEAKIVGVEGNIGGVLVPEDIEILKHEDWKFSNLDLLSLVVDFTVADAICDLSVHEPMMAPNVTAFGASGKEEVLKFKESFLGPQGNLGKPAYNLEYPYEVFLQKAEVTFGFKCLIEGYLGEGTEFVFVNQDLLIEKIKAVRHTGEVKFD